MKSKFLFVIGHPAYGIASCNAYALKFTRKGAYNELKKRGYKHEQIEDRLNFLCKAAPGTGA